MQASSYSRCAHGLHALLMSDFKLRAISLCFNSGTGGVEGLLLYLMVDKGAAVPLYHWRAPPPERLSFPSFPLLRQVHGAANRRAKCFSQMSSTFGCACLVCFYGIKERSHEKRPGRPSLTRRLGAAREQQRPHNSACSRGWSLGARPGQRTALLSINLWNLWNHTYV